MDTNKKAYLVKREMMIMYKAVDVARYIINFCNSHSSTISNLKLQKILYYVQAAFVVEKGSACFEDKIIAWQHGPVIRGVYDEFKKYGAQSIPVQNEVRKIIARDGKLEVVKETFDSSFLKQEDKELLERVIASLNGYGAWDLVSYTHQETPWIEVKSYNDEIQLDRIKAYFECVGNKERIYGHFDQ